MKLNQTRTMLQVLADLPPGKKISSGVATARMNARGAETNPHDVARLLSRLHVAGRITREKPAGGGPHEYFLSPAQALAARKELERDEPASALCGKSLTSHNIDLRLKFLRHLKENTVFAESPALDLIIGDYRTTAAHLAEAETNALA